MSGQLDFRMAALSFQERLARMRRNTDELTANVHRLAEQQENLAGQLREKAQDVDHLAEQCCRADEELHTARIEARDADSRLASAAAAVNKALQRPTPFYVSPSGNTACRSSCAVVSTLRGVPSAEVDAWLRHHTVGLGFCRAYLFYDDPAELRDHSTLLDKYQQSVVAIGVDDDCRLLYPTCYRYRTQLPFEIRDQVCDVTSVGLHALLWLRGAVCSRTHLAVTICSGSCRNSPWPPEPSV
eukprot:TRINITY_DN17891_c0_g1_i2.p1 TRINITY_DN17891_c0_g1~~TRINITY_DN17891_c0_g1_i2.p1  ORF type:complete len:242 (-),score=14.43 TRINITY_DN17891_c0_g1_i2:284-1009(-)